MSYQQILMCMAGLCIILAPGCSRDEPQPLTQGESSDTAQTDTVTPEAESDPSGSDTTDPPKSESDSAEETSPTPSSSSEAASQPDNTSDEPDEPAAGDVDALFARLDAFAVDGDFIQATQLARDYVTEYPADPRIAEVHERLSRLTQMRRNANRVRYAIQQLNNPDRTARQVARQQLREGGEAAVLLLRKAVREADDQTSVAAAYTLQDMFAISSYHDIRGRMAETDSSEVANQLLNITVKLTQLQPESDIRDAAVWLSTSQKSDHLKLARALLLRLDDLPESTITTQARSAVSQYLRSFVEQQAPREVLQIVQPIVSISGDDALIQQYQEIGLLFYLYEPFLIGENPGGGEYSTSSIRDQDPAIPGTANQWSSASVNSEIRSQALTHPALTPAGGSLGHNRSGGSYTSVSRPLEKALGNGDARTTVWFASLHRVSGFDNDGNRSLWEYKLGGDTIRWGIHEKGLHAFGENIDDAKPDQTYLFLVKLEKNARDFDERWSVWVFAENQTIPESLGEPDVVGIKDVWKNDHAIDHLRFELQGDSRHNETAYIDEIQIAQRLIDLNLKRTTED